MARRRFLWHLLALAWLAMGASSALASRGFSAAERRILAEIGRQRAAGLRPALVVDLDNTLTDSRHRTRAAARIFGHRVRGARALRGLRLEQIRYDARQTAQRAGLDERTTARFERFWLRYFWHPSSMRHDKPVRRTVDLVRAAKAAGAEVFYLSGRTSELRVASLRQLWRFRLPDARPDRLLTKATEAVNTSRFKRGQVLRLRRLGFHLSAFISDAPSDIAAVQDLVPCALVDFPVGPSRRPAIDVSTLLLSTSSATPGR